MKARRGGVTPLRTSIPVTLTQYEHRSSLVAPPMIFQVVQCVTVRCSVLQCVTVCCSVLQCVAVLDTRSRMLTHNFVVQCGAVRCNVVQCGAVRCRVFQCVEVCCMYP